MPIKNRTLLIIVIAAATASIAYMCWNKRTEWLSGLGLGTGMIDYGIGPSYEGYEPNSEKKEPKGVCGACQ